MCGRFLVLSERDAAEVLIEMTEGRIGDGRRYEGRDVYPKNTAPVFVQGAGIFRVENCLWGLPMRGKSDVIYNARAESVEEKPSFRELFKTQRCVVPSLGFYEWSRTEKKLHRFNMPSGELLFMAGLWFKDETPRFTIVTAPANESMAPVHHRMPLVLGAEYALDWITNNASATELLTLTPPQLRNITV